MARPSLGGMLATRQGALILAVLCAACAAGVLLIALSSYKKSVQTTVKQATVLVATGEIQKGTSGDAIAAEKLYKSTPIVATQLQPGAVSDASQLLGKVTAVDVLPGAQLTAADFTTTLGVGSLLTPNQRAISIPSDQVHSNLAVLNAGDRVDLYAEIHVGGGSSAGGSAKIFLLAPNVLVLKTPTSGLAGAATAAQTNASSGSGGSSAAPASSTIVFAMNSALVSDVALTADNGQLWIALRPAKATAPIGGINTIGDLITQAASAAPAAPPGFGATINNKNTTTGGH
jgi:Flp pilus assembly protein CpaB